MSGKGGKKKVVYRKPRTTAPAKKVSGKPAKNVINMAGKTTTAERKEARLEMKNRNR